MRETVIHSTLNLCMCRRMNQNMIDIHCHLLPNVDDGPTSWEESLEMARIASQDGIRIAVTTPHWVQRTGWEPSPNEIKKKVEVLNKCKYES